MKKQVFEFKEVPVFSKIKMIDGKVVGLLEGYKKLPVELLPKDGEYPCIADRLN
ncbi:hypothetical protein ACFSMW_13280 [Virgibacillus halophilus]|uniref:Uncharacterized protein n=1 Tax=Tigheibacillus halophilus TaxID=361280 RepID=A0ABU5C7Q9_9BACI|nr:hypothetical protein [Virgibacillus halophilus]